MLVYSASFLANKEEHIDIKNNAIADISKIKAFPRIYPFSGKCREQV